MKTMQLKDTATISLIILSFLLVIPGAHIFAKDKAKKGIAKAIILRGNVKAKLSSGKIVTIKRDKWVPEGAIIRTGEQSFVKFLFVDKSQMNLGPKSQMEIAEFPEDEAGVINLVKGKLRSKVTKDYMKIKEEDKSKLFIKTETAAMGVRGTDFRVDYNNRTQQTDLTTFEGKVSMARIDKNVADMKRGAQRALEKAVSGDRAVMVKQGQAASIAPGRKAPQAPRSLSKDEMKAKQDSTTTDREPASESSGENPDHVPPGLNENEADPEKEGKKDKLATGRGPDSEGSDKSTSDSGDSERNPDSDLSDGEDVDSDNSEPEFPDPPEAPTPKPPQFNDTTNVQFKFEQ